jgi:hypothetical protein
MSDQEWLELKPKGLGWQLSSTWMETTLKKQEHVVIVVRQAITASRFTGFDGIEAPHE